MKQSKGEKDYTDILNKIFAGVIIVIALAVVNTVILLSNSKETTTEKKTTKETTEETNYDVSMFNEVDVAGALALFSSKETQLLYIGRPDCSACVAFLPTLQEAQANYGYTTNYLNLNNAVSSTVDQKALSSFLGKLTKKETTTISDQKTTGTYGKDFWGVTPMLVVIKNGKQVDGLLGAYPYEKVSDLIEKYELDQKAS